MKAHQLRRVFTSLVGRGEEVTAPASPTWAMDQCQGLAHGGHGGLSLKCALANISWKVTVDKISSQHRDRRFRFTYGVFHCSCFMWPYLKATVLLPYFPAYNDGNHLPEPARRTFVAEDFYDSMTPRGRVWRQQESPKTQGCRVRWASQSHQLKMKCCHVFVLKRGLPGSLQAGNCPITAGFTRGAVPGWAPSLRDEGKWNSIRAGYSTEKRKGYEWRNLRPAWLNTANWRESRNLLPCNKTLFGAEEFQVCLEGLFWTACSSFPSVLLQKCFASLHHPREWRGCEHGEGDVPREKGQDKIPWGICWAVFRGFLPSLYAPFTWKSWAQQRNTIAVSQTGKMWHSEHPELEKAVCHHKAYCNSYMFLSVPPRPLSSHENEKNIMAWQSPFH